MPHSRFFAVVPAAGQSRRMGRPKLLLPYRGTTILGSLMASLKSPRIAACCVVIRADDAELQAEAEKHGAWVIQPAVDPPEMRTSVEIALHEIEQRYQPADSDAWLLIPADHPLLSPALLEELIAAWDQTAAEILVPSHNGRRGHPTLFRWSMVSEIRGIPADQGLNWLLRRQPTRVVEWPCDHPEVTFDLDTPEDYARLLKNSSS
jgi:molybdenum cofactor cytidylyltransferase